MGRDALVIVRPSTVTLAPGEAAEARLAVVVADGYHIQANPASDRFLVPARLLLTPRAGLRAGKPVYPPGQRHRIEGAANDLLTYEGIVEVVVPITAGQAARPGTHVLQGVLHYQACDERTCFFPAYAPVILSVFVVAAPPRAGATTPTWSAATPANLSSNSSRLGQDAYE